jgi:hypothetical protein
MYACISNNFLNVSCVEGRSTIWLVQSIIRFIKNDTEPDLRRVKLHRNTRLFAALFNVYLANVSPVLQTLAIINAFRIHNVTLVRGHSRG